MDMYYILWIIVLQGSHNLVDMFIPGGGRVSIRRHGGGSGKEKVGGERCDAFFDRPYIEAQVTGPYLNHGNN